MNSALLLLIIAIPLGASALSTIVRSRLLDRILLIGIPALITAAGLYLLAVHIREPVIAHSVGGFVDGLAIPFVSDTFAALLLTVTSVAALVCSWFLIATGEDQYRFMPALILMMLTGVYGAILTGDLGEGGRRGTEEFGGFDPPRRGLRQAAHRV